MNRKFSLLLAILTLLFAMVFLAGCKPDFDEVHSSAQGYMLEQVFPEQTWFFLSVSTLDEEQRELFRAFIARFSSDPDAFRNTLLEGIDKNLESVNLSYFEDIQPVIGTDGVRFAMGLSDDSNGGSFTHVALTLADPAEAQNLFSGLEAQGRFVVSTRNEFKLYYNVTAEEDTFYFSIFEDLLVISNNEDELVNMLSLARSEGGASLWTNDDYQEVIEELPSQHVAMIYMEPQKIAARQVEAGVVSLPSQTVNYLKSQGIALVTVENGIEFEGIAFGDREKIKADKTSLDKLNAKKRYLYKEVPGDGLMAYFESYNLGAELAETEEQTQGASSTYVTALQTMFGVTQDDLSKLFTEGYSIAVHHGEGFIPGISVMMDVSDASLTAQALIDTIDDQLSSWVALFQLQGGTFAQALKKTEAEIQGGTFNVLTLDLDAVMASYDTGQGFALPDELQGLELVLAYGLTEEDRLLLTVYDGWLSDPKTFLDDEPTFASATQGVKKLKEGMFYIDFNELFAYLEKFTAFRDALSADADSILNQYAGLTEEEVVVDEEVTVEGEAVVEGEGVPVDPESIVDETGELVVTEEDVTGEGIQEDGSFLAEVLEEEESAVDWLAFLAPLKSFAFASQAEKYEIRMGGSLLLDEQ